VDRAIAARGPRVASRRVAARLGGARIGDRVQPSFAEERGRNGRDERERASCHERRRIEKHCHTCTLHAQRPCTYLTHTHARIHVDGDGPPDSPNLFFCFPSLHLFSRSRLSSAGSSFLRRRAVSPLYDLTKTSAPARDPSSSPFPPMSSCSSLQRSFSSFPLPTAVVTFNGSSRRYAMLRTKLRLVGRRCKEGGDNDDDETSDGSRATGTRNRRGAFVHFLSHRIFCQFVKSLSSSSGRSPRIRSAMRTARADRTIVDARREAERNTRKVIEEG